jgi:hypothetical protein
MRLSGGVGTTCIDLLWHNVGESELEQSIAQTSYLGSPIRAPFIEINRKGALHPLQDDLETNTIHF